MAIDQDRAFAPENFHRFAGERDMKDGAPVGTFSMDAEATGDSGGGTVQIIIQGTKDMFGFRAILIPTAVVYSAVTDPGNALFTYTHTGNGHLQSASQIQMATDMVAVGGNYFAPEFVLARVLVEPDKETNADLFQVKFDTNTDGTLYHLHVFGVVFDHERLSRVGKFDKLAEFLAG